MAAADRGVFGSPISDSRWTLITEKATRALAIIFAPRDFTADELAEAAGMMAELASFPSR